MGSKRTTGKRLIWIGGGWILVWAIPTVVLVLWTPFGWRIASLPLHGEIVGCVVMVVMLMIPGLFLMLAGILAVRFGRTSRESDTPDEAPETESPKRPRLTTAGTLVGALAGCSAAFMAFMIYVTILDRVLARWGILEDPTIAMVVKLGVTAVGAVVGFVEGRRLVDR